MTLKCIAIKCRKKVSADKLLCEPHWLIVPRKLKIELIENFKPGRDTTVGKMSADFRKAISDVIRDLTIYEGHDIPPPDCEINGG